MMAVSDSFAVRLDEKTGKLPPQGEAERGRRKDQSISEHHTLREKAVSGRRKLPELPEEVWKEPSDRMDKMGSQRRRKLLTASHVSGRRKRPPDRSPVQKMSSVEDLQKLPPQVLQQLKEEEDTVETLMLGNNVQDVTKSIRAKDRLSLIRLKSGKKLNVSLVEGSFHRITGIQQQLHHSQSFILRKIQLQREPGKSLGFYIQVGDGRSQEEGIFVSRVNLDSFVGKNKLLNVGDEIISINKIGIKSLSLDQVVLVMQYVKRLVLTVKTQPLHDYGAVEHDSDEHELIEPYASVPADLIKFDIGSEEEENYATIAETLESSHLSTKVTPYAAVPFPESSAYESVSNKSRSEAGSGLLDDGFRLETLASSSPLTFLHQRRHANTGGGGGGGGGQVQTYARVQKKVSSPLSSGKTGESPLTSSSISQTPHSSVHSPRPGTLCGISSGSHHGCVPEFNLSTEGVGGEDKELSPVESQLPPPLPSPYAPDDNTFKSSDNGGAVGEGDYAVVTPNKDKTIAHQQKMSIEPTNVSASPKPWSSQRRQRHHKRRKTPPPPPPPPPAEDDNHKREAYYYLDEII